MKISPLMSLSKIENRSEIYFCSKIGLWRVVLTDVISPEWISFSRHSSGDLKVR